MCSHTVQGPSTPLPNDIRREFTDHEGMASNLETRVYFAHPHDSWVRGLNENTNGLIWQYFPKYRDMTTVTEHEIKRTMGKLNHHPRKSLGFRTPHVGFFDTKDLVTVILPKLNQRDRWGRNMKK